MAATKSTVLPIPEHFDPSKVGQLWKVPYQARAAEAAAWALEWGIPAAASDRRRVCLLLVDLQNTFCLPGFELFVGGRSGTGAVDDNVRLCRFIYQNLARITEIDCSLDTHTAMQIFHPVFWINGAGEHPAPFTLIQYDEVKGGKWKANPAVAASLSGGNYAALQQHALHYVRKLSEPGKYPLEIWPYHAMFGGLGHALVPAVEEACFFHNLARRSQTGFEIKGANPLTENYSVLRPEILDSAGGRLIAQRNARFVRKLLDFDILVIAGQAKSHCVAWTIDDLLGEITPQLRRKVYLLEDCTSPVVVPGVIDYTDRANASFRRFASLGVHVVKSTDPLETWPDAGF